jgi:hypothetical protein
VGNRLIVLDQNITAEGTGVIRIFKPVPMDDGIGLETELTIDGTTFN